MSYTVVRAQDAFWRPSNQMQVDNTDLGRQLGLEHSGARMWRLQPGQASTRHRHRQQEEIYVLLEGTGRLRVDGELLTLSPYDAARVGSDSLRQVFNDTDSEQLWLVLGAPPEPANTAEMDEQALAELYPDGPQAMPPELGGE